MRDLATRKMFARFLVPKKMIVLTEIKYDQIETYDNFLSRVVWNLPNSFGQRTRYNGSSLELGTWNPAGDVLEYWEDILKCMSVCGAYCRYALPRGTFQEQWLQ